MTAPYLAPLYIPGKATVQMDPPVSPTYAGLLLPLSLSFSELSVCISLLPSHLSDLTVGGSPPEPPPVSADFLLQALVPDDQATRGLAATQRSIILANLNDTC